MTIPLTPDRHISLRPALRRAAWLISFLATTLPAFGGTIIFSAFSGSPAQNLRIFFPEKQQDTTDVIYIRIYRDSVRDDTSGYHQVEARVEEGSILSVFVDGREIPEESYEIYIAPLMELLEEEKKLKEELFTLMNEITVREKEMDSLLNTPLVVEGHAFNPEEDVQVQVFSFLMEQMEANERASDTVPVLPPMIPENKIRELSGQILDIKALRNENREMLAEDLTMLRQKADRIREQLANIDASFSVEKVPVNVQPEQGNQPLKREKRRERKKKRKKKQKR